MGLINNPVLANSGTSNIAELTHTHVGTGTSAFVAGELIYLNSGVITTMSAADAGALTAAVIYGQALTDDGAAATEVVVRPIKPNQLWRIKLSASGTANTAASYTLNTKYGLYHSGSTWYADSAVTNQDMIIYVGPSGEPGKTLSASTWGLFTFLASICQTDIGT